MIAKVQVDVALRRPPRVDAQVVVIVQADNDVDALLAAVQVAQADPRVVMPVGSRILDLLSL